MDMEIVDNFNEAGNFTGKVLKNIGNMIVLIILSIIPIVDFIALGYEARIIREGKNLSEPPKLSEYGKLFVDGLKIVLAVIVYAIIPVAILTALVLLTVPLIGFNLIFSPWTVLPQIAGLVILALITLFFFLIFGVAAIGNMIRTNKFMKVFAFGETWAIISKMGFAKYIVWLILIFILGIISGGLSAIPAVGWFIGMIVGVFVGIFVARSFGTWLDEILGPSVQPPPAPAAIPSPPTV